MRQTKEFRVEYCKKKNNNDTTIIIINNMRIGRVFYYAIWDVRRRLSKFITPISNKKQANNFIQ